jgi:hypothetical protein
MPNRRIGRISTWTVGLVAVAAAGISIGLAPTAAASPPKSPMADDPAGASVLVALVNAERLQAGVGPVVLRPDVTAVAQAHSRQMAARGSIFHNDAYFSSESRLRLGAGALGENVSVHPTVLEAHSSLMRSPGHRANILDPRFSIVGFAVTNKDGHAFITEDFMAPARGTAPAPAPAATRPAATAPARDVARAAPPVAPTTAPPTTTTTAAPIRTPKPAAVVVATTAAPPPPRLARQAIIPASTAARAFSLSLPAVMGLAAANLALAVTVLRVGRRERIGTMWPISHPA